MYIVFLRRGNRLRGVVFRVFALGARDQSSITDRFIPKTSTVVDMTTLFRADQARVNSVLMNSV